MRSGLNLTAAVVVLAVLAVSLSQAKEGVRAIVHTPDLEAAEHGARIVIDWSLEVEETGEPFSACAVFIRLIGPGGESTEASGGCGKLEAGRYTANAEVPPGGISTIKIGIAGTMTDRDGNRRRSDLLVPVATAAE